MHVSLSRVRQQIRGRLLTGAALALTGTALGVFWAVSAPQAAQRTDADATITGSLPPRTQDIPFELRIQITREGKEGVELAGRLSEDGGLITRPIAWTIRHAGPSGQVALSSASPAFTANSSVSSTKLSPGHYVLEASYGTVSMVKPFELPKGQHLGFTFIFNVGGLRTLSTIQQEPLPVAMRAVHKVYAVSGAAAGQLVATSDVPGGLMRLGAGKYRLESEIEPGNTVTRTDVTIRPGVLTTLQLDHKAGVLAIDAAKQTSWTLTDSRTLWKASGSGAHLLTLAPGSYTWSDGKHERKLEVEPGKNISLQAN